MTETIRFTLDGREVEALAGESIWQVAQREGIAIPHLCWLPEPGYRADGNCRACMVEVEGERVLAASCIRKPSPGMKVATATERAVTARRMVMELLVADQPPRADAHDPGSRLWDWAQQMEVEGSRFPARDQPPADFSHPSMAVQLDACIQCNLCVRACREVQVNDVIGMAGRGHHELIVFDQGDPMGDSTCVACGECVQACPTGALLPKSVVDLATGRGDLRADREVASVCPFCGVGCQITYHVKDEKIAYVTGRDGPANENRLCVKGRFGFDYAHSPQRLTKPLIRRADAPKSVEPGIDPRDPWTHFREASWDEALEVAARGLAAVRDRDGGDALAGFGSAKCSNEEAYLFQKLIRTGFHTNNVDHCTRLCHASSVAALFEGVGSGAVSTTYGDVVNADVAIVAGSNTPANHPVASSFFKQAQRGGTTIIYVDPRADRMSEHADIFCQLKPGTDVAFYNSVMHEVIRLGLVDEEYVAARTSNVEALAATVAHYPPERGEQITGVPAGIIRQVARLWGEAGAGVIFWGMGISQHTTGTDNARCLIAMCAITGHVGRPGTGLHPLRGQNNVQGASDAGLIPMFYPDYQPVDADGVRDRFEAAWERELDPERGLTVTEIVASALHGGVRGMYMMGENPFLSDPNINKVRKALSALDFLVVQDIFLTETAEFADVVLPATSAIEKDGTYTNTDRRVQIGRKVLDPPGQARPDWQIIQDIANRVGLPMDYDSPSEIFDELVSLMPNYAGLRYGNLGPTGKLYPNPDPEHSDGTVVLFDEHFGTDDGLAHLVPAEWMPARELPSEEYPYILNTGRLLEHWHTGSMTRRSFALDAIQPEAHVFLNPDDARAMGVSDGDFVRISSRRGTIELRARLSHRDTPGTCFVPFHFREAAANLLTIDEIDPFGKIPEFKFCAVRIEPAGGAAAHEAQSAREGA